MYSSQPLSTDCGIWVLAQLKEQGIPLLNTLVPSYKEGRYFQMHFCRSFPCGKRVKDPDLEGTPTVPALSEKKSCSFIGF